MHLVISPLRLGQHKGKNHQRLSYLIAAKRRQLELLLPPPWQLRDILLPWYLQPRTANLSSASSELLRSRLRSIRWSYRHTRPGSRRIPYQLLVFPAASEHDDRQTRDSQQLDRHHPSQQPTRAASLPQLDQPAKLIRHGHPQGHLPGFQPRRQSPLISQGFRYGRQKLCGFSNNKPAARSTSRDPAAAAGSHPGMRPSSN